MNPNPYYVVTSEAWYKTYGGLTLKEALKRIKMERKESAAKYRKLSRFSTPEKLVVVKITVELVQEDQ